VKQDFFHPKIREIGGGGYEYDCSVIGGSRNRGSDCIKLLLQSYPLVTRACPSYHSVGPVRSALFQIWNSARVKRTRGPTGRQAPLDRARFLSPTFCPPTLFNHRSIALILCYFLMVCCFYCNYLSITSVVGANTVIPPYFADFGMKKSGLKNREIGGTAK